MSGKIVGYRTTAVKRVQQAFIGGRLRKVYFVDALIESLHSTKGWRAAGKKRHFIDQYVWSRFPATFQTFDPSYPKKIQIPQQLKRRAA
jgi:hypothetical protein